MLVSVAGTSPWFTHKFSVVPLLRASSPCRQQGGSGKLRAWVGRGNGCPVVTKPFCPPTRGPHSFCPYLRLSERRGRGAEFLDPGRRRCKGKDPRTRGWAVTWSVVTAHRSLVTWAFSFCWIPTCPGLSKRSLISRNYGCATFNPLMVAMEILALIGSRELVRFSRLYLGEVTL